MRDDVSAIPVNGCNVISDYGFISNYNGSVKKDFILNGGKWYFYRTQNSSYGNYDITYYNCIDVSNLNSNAVFEPFIYFVAFCLVVFVLLLVRWVWGGMFHVN